MAAAGAAALAVLAGCTAEPPDPAAPTPAGPADLAQYLEQEVRWQPCPASDEFLDEIPAGLECATVRVPVAYAGAADQGDFSIALVKAPSVGPAAGAILVNPGGPGASGFDMVALGADDLRRNLPGYDIVGFDPRGVSRSDGLDCGEPTDVRRGLIELDRTPEDPGELDAVLDAYDAYEAACRDNDARWGFLGTASVAQDVALVSQVLGDERIHYYGMSYGSEIGYALLRAFPDRIGRMILESPVDPRSRTSSWTSSPPSTPPSPASWRTAPRSRSAARGAPPSRSGRPSWTPRSASRSRTPSGRSPMMAPPANRSCSTA